MPGNNLQDTYTAIANFSSLINEAKKGQAAIDQIVQAFSGLGLAGTDALTQLSEGSAELEGQLNLFNTSVDASIAEIAALGTETAGASGSFGEVGAAAVKMAETVGAAAATMGTEISTALGGAFEGVFAPIGTEAATVFPEVSAAITSGLAPLEAVQLETISLGTYIGELGPIAETAGSVIATAFEDAATAAQSATSVIQSSFIGALAAVRVEAEGLGADLTSGFAVTEGAFDGLFDPLIEGAAVASGAVTDVFVEAIASVAELTASIEAAGLSLTELSAVASSLPAISAATTGSGLLGASALGSSLGPAAVEFGAVSSAAKEASSAEDIFTDSNTRLGRGIFGLTQAARGGDGALRGVAQSMSLVNGSAGALIAVVAAVSIGLGAVGLRFDAQQESIKTGFTQILGSGKQAQDLLANIDKTATITPFDPNTLAAGVRTLLDFGFKLQDVFTGAGKSAKGLLVTLAETTASKGGTNADLTALVQTVGEIQAKGTLTAQSLKSLADEGVPIDALQKKLGLTAAQMADIGKAGVTANATIVALQDVLNARFGGALVAQSQTLKGELTGLKDELELGLGGAVAGIASGIKPVLASLVSSLSDFEQQVQKVGLAKALEQDAPAVLEIFNSIKTALSGVIDFIKSAEPAIGGFAEALAAIGTVAIVGPLTALGDILKIIADLLEKIPEPALEVVGVFAGVAFAFTKLNTILSVSRIAISTLSALVPGVAQGFAALGSAIAGTDTATSLAPMAEELGLISKAQAALIVSSAASSDSLEVLEGTLTGTAVRAAAASGEYSELYGVLSTLGADAIPTAASLQALADSLAEAMAVAEPGSEEFFALAAAQKAAGLAALDMATSEQVLVGATAGAEEESVGFLASIAALNPALLAVAAGAALVYGAYKILSDSAAAAAKANVSVGDSSDIVAKSLKNAGDVATSFRAISNSSGSSLSGISDAAQAANDKAEKAFTPLINSLHDLDAASQKVRLIEIGVNLTSQGFKPTDVIAQINQLQKLAGLNFSIKTADITGFQNGLKAAADQAKQINAEMSKTGDTITPKIADNLKGVADGITKDFTAGNFKSAISQLAEFQKVLQSGAGGTSFDAIKQVTQDIAKNLGSGFSLQNTQDLATLLLQLGNTTTKDVNPGVKEFAKGLKDEAQAAIDSGNYTKLYAATIKAAGDAHITTAQKEKLDTEVKQLQTAATKEQTAALKDYTSAAKNLAGELTSYSSAGTAFSAFLDTITDAQKKVATSASENAGLGSDAWQQFATNSIGSLQKFDAFLQAQITAQNDYQTNLSNIAAKFGPKFAQEIAALGPQAAGIAAEVLNAPTSVAQQLLNDLDTSTTQITTESSQNMETYFTTLSAIAKGGQAATLQAIASATGQSKAQVEQQLAEYPSLATQIWDGLQVIGDAKGKAAAAALSKAIASGDGPAQAAMKQLVSDIAADASSTTIKFDIGVALNAADVANVNSQLASLGNKSAVGTTTKGGLGTHSINSNSPTILTFAEGGFAESVSTFGVLKKFATGGTSGWQQSAASSTLPPQAVIMPPQGANGIFQWAEPSTKGEAFIPLTDDPTQRSKSISIWQKTGQLLGQMAYGGFSKIKSFAVGGVTSFAGGGIPSGPQGPGLVPQPNSVISAINAGTALANAASKAATDAATKAANAAKAAADAATSEFFTELKNYHDYQVSLESPRDQITSLTADLNAQIAQGHAWSSDALSIRQKIDQLNSQIFGDAVKAAQNQHDFNFKNNENPQQQLADLNQQLADATAANGPWSDAATQIRQNIVDLTKQIADDASQAAAQALSDAQQKAEAQIQIEESMNSRLQQLSTDRKNIYSTETDAINQANQAYADAIKSKTQSLLTSISATAIPSSGTATPSITSAQLLSNLTTQNQTFTQFNDALRAAQNKGISQTALTTLGIQGPQDLGTLKAALGLDPTTLNALVNERLSQSQATATTLDTTDLDANTAATAKASQDMLTQLQTLNQQFGTDWAALLQQANGTTDQDRISAEDINGVTNELAQIASSIASLSNQGNNNAAIAPQPITIPQFSFGGPVTAPANGTLAILDAGEPVLTADQAKSTSTLMENLVNQTSPGSATTDQTMVLHSHLYLDGKEVYDNQQKYKVRADRTKNAQSGKLTGVSTNG